MKGLNSRGHLTEYGIDIMEVAKKSGAHVIVMVDHDYLGIKIASETPTDTRKVFWFFLQDKNR